MSNSFMSPPSDRLPTKLLIADDNDGVALALAELSRDWGYHPQLAQDGAEALEALLAPDAPQLALLDWRMPSIDGIEVSRRLRQEESGRFAHLILMTGE